MFFSRLISTSKKGSNGKILHRAYVVELYQTKESRIKYYGIKIGSKFGCNKNGEPISSSNYKAVRQIAWKYNRSLDEKITHSI